ncbi:MULTISPECIES: sensor histidine kinase [Sphingobacterium]|uniref:ATP-binding protein n=1 Tax=Sphingobacterium TaxID=28453 RepID=UPI0010440D29|nr:MULTISPECIES: sensor histidine kinase [Sphingobacterium]MCW2262132.1 signal transduction histidine kinase [Sphingobacterium kitahiroshimense]TCR13121.1 tetratricopeptide repeat protein [Sphingobacterium sp. JUb78]
MYKILLLFAYFLLSIGNTSAQSPEQLTQYSDSLYRQLQQIEDTEEKALALLDLSFFWSDYNTEKALHYVSASRKLLGDKANTDYYQGLLSFYLGAIQFDVDLAQAKKLYMQAENFLKGDIPTKSKISATHYRARLWGSYGALLQREGKAHEYVQVLIDKVIPMAKSIKDSTLWGNNLQNVAMALMNLQEYSKAEQYYNNALTLLHDRNAAAEQRFTLFVNAARNALLNNKYTHSRIFLDSASHTSKSVSASSYLPTYYSVEGSYWEKQRDFDLAHIYFEKALVGAKEQHNSDMVASILFSQSAAFQTANKPASAMKKLREVLPYIEKNPSLKNKEMVYYNLATTAVQLGAYQEAVKWFEKHKIVLDTLLADKGTALTLELEKKYQTSEKENELLRVKAAHQQQQLKMQRTRLFAGIFLLTSIILGMLSLIWYISSRNRKKLASQREKLNLFNAMVQGQERERSRIARDLHDGLGGMLASVKLKLSAVANREAKVQPQTDSAMDLYTIINQMDDSVNELRRIARNMMPESLLYMGLELSLRDLCNAMNQPQLKIDFQATNLQSDYPQSFLIAVYRIVQELLTNALKHSGATQIWVQCSEADHYFYITVEDNGKGFDPSMQDSKQGGIGLSNIRNRVDILNGRLEIDAAIGKGASFHIQFELIK